MILTALMLCIRARLRSGGKGLKENWAFAPLQRIPNEILVQRELSVVRTALRSKIGDGMRRVPSPPLLMTQERAGPGLVPRLRRSDYSRDWFPALPGWAEVWKRPYGPWQGGRSVGLSDGYPTSPDGNPKPRPGAPTARLQPSPEGLGNPAG